jgi:hypothetical protein
MVPRRRYAAPIRPALPASPALALSALALVCAVGLTACTSGSAKPSRTGTTTSAAAAAPASGGRAVAPATLATTLQRGLATATSAHLAVSTVLAGQTLQGAGDVALARGVIARADLRQALPSGLGSIRIVVVGSKTYAELPSALNTRPGKPWVLLAPGSKSIVVSQLASTVQPILAVASPASLVAFARAASSARDLGPATVGGVATTHYRVVVDASKLPASVPSSITAGGRSSIPIDMYLDSAGRPRQVSGTFSISGQTVTPTIVLSAYDAPVSISAPPAGQVGTR